MHDYRADFFFPPSPGADGFKLSKKTKTFHKLSNSSLSQQKLQMCSAYFPGVGASQNT